MPDAVARLNAALEGRYRIESELGEGGMATVYLADDLKHERKVALKVLKPELAAVVGAERFLAEIKTTANLQHPNILPLFDSGEADGFLFYVMPYVEGESLRDRLDREKQLPVDEAVRIATDVAEALHAAHDQMVIHRDIKPANILMSKGRPVVADFGIALAVSAAGGGRLTETGLSMGTPYYMSPEQATGDQVVGRATDTYALGCVLFEMLVGEPPYTGSTAQAVLGKIIGGAVSSVTAQRPAVPPNVDAAIAKALEKLPADRFTSAQDFARALTDPGFRHGEHAGPAGTAAAGGPWNRLSIAMTALSAVLGAILGWQLLAPEPPAPLTRFIVSAPEGVTIGGVCCGPQQALSPDGEWLAFTDITGGAIQRRRRGQLSAEPIPGTEGGRMPFFSPDSRWLGFYAGGRLHRVPMTGGPPQSIALVPEPNTPSWGDNDVIALTVQEDGSLYTVPVGGGVPTPVGGASEGVAYGYPWMLPSGEAALLVAEAPDPSDNRTVVVDLESGVADTLGFGTLARYAAGHLLFTGADGTVQAQPFDPAKRRTTGPSVAFLDGVAVAGPSRLGQIAVSQEGGLAYQTGGAATAGGQALTIVGPGGSVPVPLPEEGDIEFPAFSPVDGRRIALVFMNVGERQDIWIWDRDQTTLGILTVEGSSNLGPVWMPDGSRIAFSSIRDAEPPQIYWQAADGSDAAERLLETDFPTFPDSWAPDGRTLALNAVREGTRDIGLFTLGDSAVTWRVATEFDEFHPQISPDGAWLAYTSDRSGQLEVYVEPLSGDGGRTTVSTAGGHSPRWAPQGDVLFYAGGTTASESIIAATFTTEGGFRVVSREERLTIDDLNFPAGVNYDVSPDGEELVHVVIGGAAGGGNHLVWILNWPEIVREMTTAN